MTMIKKLYITILILILCFSCTEHKEKGTNFEKKLETEINSGIRNDTIFLGYTFGMSKKEFAQKTKNLRKEGKLYVNKSDMLAYKMTIAENDFGKDVEATYSPDFYQDKLFELGVSVKSTKYNTPELTQLQLVNLFTNKYGSYDHKEESVLEDYDNYIWIDGNRHIKIAVGFTDARIFYTDILAKREFENQKKTEQKNELKETTSNL